MVTFELLKIARCYRLVIVVKTTNSLVSISPQPLIAVVCCCYYYLLTVKYRNKSCQHLRLCKAPGPGLLFAIRKNSIMLLRAQLLFHILASFSFSFIVFAFAALLWWPAVFTVYFVNRFLRDNIYCCLFL